MMTLEQRRESMRKARERKAQQAAALPPSPSDEEMLLMQHAQQTSTQPLNQLEGGSVVDAVSGEAGQLASQQGKLVNYVSHVTDEKRLVFDPQGNARVVPAGNLPTVLKNGMSVNCPLCGTRHATLGPNACPAREPRKWMPCTICGKQIYEGEPPSNPAIVQDEYYVEPKLPSRADRESALQARLDAHMLQYHPSEAYQYYGLRPTAATPAR